VDGHARVEEALSRHECEAAIVRALEVGNTRTDASLGAGIDRHTFVNWCQRYPSFLAAVERAEAVARQRFVGQVALAARTSWQAAAWVLEPRPGELGPPRAHARCHRTGRRRALPAVFEIGQERESGRGERDSPATTDLLVMRLAEPPEPCEWLKSA